jgi:hypothetical protein
MVTKESIRSHLVLEPLILAARSMLWGLKINGGEKVRTYCDGVVCWSAWYGLNQLVPVGEGETRLNLTLTFQGYMLLITTQYA